MESKCRTALNGTRRWYLNDMKTSKYHREDGPAIEWSTGENFWYLNGIEYVEPEEMPLNLFLAYVKWELNKQKNNC